jgi:S1-C subfamily serine protease
VVLGDIIVAIDGQQVRSSDELRLRLEQRRTGDTVTVTVDRDGKKRDLPIRLGEPN